MAFTMLRSPRKGVQTVALLAAMMLSLNACSSSTSNGTSSEGSSSDGASPTAAATGTATAAADASGEIKAASAYDLGGTIDPATTSGALPLAANWHVMEGLVDLDRVDFKPYAALAKEMPKKIDDTHYEVTLRDNAKFSDGTPVTADDVVFSYKRVMDNTSGFYDDFISFIDSVEPVDQQTIKFTLKEPFSLFTERLSIVKIVPKALVEKSEEDYGKLPVGSGPWKYVSATPNDKVVFAPNEYYNGPKPAKAKSMVWNLLPDAAARVTALRDETVQAMENVPPNDKDSIQADGNKVESVDSFGLGFMLFNTKKAPWNNVKARQAMFYALNMEQLIQDYAGGDGKPATSFLQESHPNYHKASTVYTYDPEKAKSLLKEAGVKEGQEVTLRVAQSWLSPMAPAIQQQFEAVGLKVNLKEMPSKALYPEIDGGDNDVVIAPGDPSVFGNDPDLLMRWWYGKNVWSEKRYAWADTPEFAKLESMLDEATKLEGDAQQKKWDEIFDYLSEQVPLYPLMHRKVPTGWNGDKLVGFKPISTTGLSFMDVSVKE